MITKSCDVQLTTAVLVFARQQSCLEAERSLQTMALFFVSLIFLFSSCQAKYLYEPLTKEVIDYINTFASWKADPDYAGYDVEHFKKLCGVPLDGNIPPRPERLGLLPGKFFQNNYKLKAN